MLCAMNIKSNSMMQYFVEQYHVQGIYQEQQYDEVICREYQISRAISYSGNQTCSSGMSKGKQNAVKTLVSHGAGRKNVKDESGAGPSQYLSLFNF